MNFEDQSTQEDYRPRLIVWQLASQQSVQPFSTHECLLALDGIARTGKPIVVLTGERALQRPDVYDIIEYGFALGLKVIIEAEPDELTDAVLSRYSSFGPKIFRVIMDGRIVEDIDTRFRLSPQFRELEDCLRRLRSFNYEVHLSSRVISFDIRPVAFNHDFAFRWAVNGMYCHLSFLSADVDRSSDVDEQNGDPAHDLIEAIARMKLFSPKNMYVSPQCVKYGVRQLIDGIDADASYQCSAAKVWDHWCLGGKSFAFISPDGSVQICMGQPKACGDLRSNGYDFKKIWESSDVFNSLRDDERTCKEVRERLDTVGSDLSEDIER